MPPQGPVSDDIVGTRLMPPKERAPIECAR